MKRPFEIVDHTADVGIVAYGRDVEELFANAAMALFSLITDVDSVEEKVRLNTEVGGDGIENLLVNWLNELIYIFDVQRILFRRIEVAGFTGDHLEAVCYGEHLNPTRHTLKVGVKAATYHMLQLDRDGDGYRAQVIFDI
ncbi:MAG: archease [Dehalococcoidia bacterium]